MAEADNYKSIEESLLPKLREEKAESGERITWTYFFQEVKRLARIAGPMVPVICSQFLLQVISTMMVGHLGELYLAGCALAISLAGVTGFSFLVSSSNYTSFVHSFFFYLISIALFPSLLFQYLWLPFCYFYQKKFR